METACLFEEGLILMGRGDASALVEAEIHQGRGNMEEEEEYMKERDAEEGKDRELLLLLLLEKHLGAIRKRREKRWTQLNRWAPLTARLAFSPAPCPTNTSAQKHRRRRRGRAQTDAGLHHAAKGKAHRTFKSAAC